MWPGLTYNVGLSEFSYDGNRIKIQMIVNLSLENKIHVIWVPCPISVKFHTEIWNTVFSCILWHFLAWNRHFVLFLLKQTESIPCRLNTSENQTDTSPNPQLLWPCIIKYTQDYTQQLICVPVGEQPKSWSQMNSSSSWGQKKWLFIAVVWNQVFFFQNCLWG